MGHDARLMVTSRFIPDIVEEFEDAIWLEVRANKLYVERFKIVNIDHLPKYIERNPELQKIV